MLKTYLHIALIGLLSTLNFTLSTTRCFAEVPRLTVVVVADGLTKDNIAQLRPYWLQSGTDNLLKETYITSLDFNHWTYGGNEALATILTGTTPRVHGYAMDTVFNRSTRRSVALLEDKTYNGIGTSLRLSSEALHSATIADQYRLDYGKNAKIYAVGIHPQTTMLMAGHAANACCWWDNIKEQWVSTTYYPEGLPSAADDWNMNAKKDKQTLNERVTHIALEVQRTQQMGLDNTPDILLLEYDLGLDDTNLDVLMNQLILRVGRKNLQLLVIGTPQGGELTAFNIDRAAALTSTYLIALYGHERWIDGGYGHSLYLNKQLIEQKKQSLPEIKNLICAFLMDFDDVAAAYSLEQAMTLEETRESVNKHCSGDIVVTIEHNWQYQPPQSTLLWWKGYDTNYPQSPINALQVKHLIYK